MCQTSIFNKKHWGTPVHKQLIWVNLIIIHQNNVLRPCLVIFLNFQIENMKQTSSKEPQISPSTTKRKLFFQSQHFLGKRSAPVIFVKSKTSCPQVLRWTPDIIATRLSGQGLKPRHNKTRTNDMNHEILVG